MSQDAGTELNCTNCAMVPERQQSECGLDLRKSRASTARGSREAARSVAPKFSGCATVVTGTCTAHGVEGPERVEECRAAPGACNRLWATPSRRARAWLASWARGRPRRAVARRSHSRVALRSHSPDPRSGPCSGTSPGASLRPHDGSNASGGPSGTRMIDLELNIDHVHAEILELRAAEQWLNGATQPSGQTREGGEQNQRTGGARKQKGKFVRRMRGVRRR